MFFKLFSLPGQGSTREGICRVMRRRELHGAEGRKRSDLLCPDRDAAASPRTAGDALPLRPPGGSQQLRVTDVGPSHDGLQ